MRDKLFKIFIPFIVMVIFNLGFYYLSVGVNFGGGYSPHVGILLISGLLLGPYGAIGSVFANFLCDLIRGYSISVASLSAVIGFCVSLLAYKVWYDNFNRKIKVTAPKLSNTSQILLFFTIIFVCGAIYAITNAKLFYLLYPSTISITQSIALDYFVNFINSSFIFGIIGIFLANHFNFIEIPKKSSKNPNDKLYFILGILFIILIVLILIVDFTIKLTSNLVILELILITVLLILYLTKPFTANIEKINSNSILDGIMHRFFLIVLILNIIGILISNDPVLIEIIDVHMPGGVSDVVIAMLILTDIIILIFLIPALSVLRYIEKRMIKPISEFSEIEKFITQNEKIELEGLLDVYSKYVDGDDEIGMLARSYSDLIKYNNYYIDNIRQIESEKERINAELEIANKIQKANLPTKAIDNDDIYVKGFSKPAKEVGGDFFDYYELDEDNVAFVIGDASGKGIPAAILALITQIMIKSLIKTKNKPSEILYSLNNQLCENNQESMFITLWLAIFNKKTKTLTFSNAGHNPPIIKQNDKYSFLKMDSGIVLGIMDDFEFRDEEIHLTDELMAYTDGITDANNKNNEMYGEKNLIRFLNNFKGTNPIDDLIKDIAGFVLDSEQFDDMTLLYLRIKWLNLLIVMLTI